MASGEVVAAWGWMSSVNNLKKQGIDVAFMTAQGRHHDMDLRYHPERQERGERQPWSMTSSTQCWRPNPENT